MRSIRFFLVSLFLLLALAACGTSSTSTGSSSTPTQAPTSAPTPTPTPHPMKWTTVQQFSGNGTKKTPIFSVPADWKLLYSCKGQNIGGVSVDGALVVTIYDNQNNVIDLAINATCKGDTKATTGETEEHQAGSIYLSVDGTGDWSLQVQVLK